MENDSLIFKSNGTVALVDKSNFSILELEIAAEVNV
jgi:hypothetical protein